MSEIVSSVTFANPNRLYAPVGRCIYCGVFSNKLAREHTIPFGLAGNALLLPKASCKTCESITGGFEQTCLRTILGPFRLRLGAPTRNPNERPTKLPLTLARAEDRTPIPLETILVPTHEFPIAFIGLRLREARILQGKEPLGSVDGEVWTRFNTDEIKRYVPSGTTEPRGVKLGKIKPITFARLLAKIGHAYAVVESGFASFRPLVTDLILGKTEEMSQCVGGEWEVPPAKQAAFELRLERRAVHGRNFLLVHIRLFSFFETPQYHVVVGEL